MAQRGNVFFDSLCATLDEKKFQNHDELVDRLLDRGNSPTEIISALMNMLDKSTGKPPPEEISIPRGGNNRNERERSPRSDRGRKERKERKPRRSDEEFSPAPKERESHQELGATRKITLSVGRQQHIKPGDVLGVILGAADINRSKVGFIKLHPGKTDVEISEDVADKVKKKLTGIKFKGYRLKVSEDT